MSAPEGSDRINDDVDISNASGLKRSGSNAEDLEGAPESKVRQDIDSLLEATVAAVEERILDFNIERPRFIELSVLKSPISRHIIGKETIKKFFKIYQFTVPSEVSKHLTGIKLFLDRSALPYPGVLDEYPAGTRAICAYSTHNSTLRNKEVVGSLVFIGPDAPEKTVNTIEAAKWASKKAAEQKAMSIQQAQEEEELWI